LGVHFINDSIGWATGDGGVILKIQTNGLIQGATGTEKTTISEPNVLIYPNPATDKLYVKLPGLSSASLQLINLDGQVVLSRKQTNQVETIDVSQLAKGIYIVKVTKGDELIIKKVVVQ
jgi:hypothetical protein